MANTLECVNNVPFKGGSPHFHKTKLKKEKGPTPSHVQKKQYLGIMFGFGVGSRELHKTKQRKSKNNRT
jgi:hypothetical protein